MSDAHLDLRVIRTKTSIKQALIELIEEKGFEALTVKDITTKANINRGTFYSHYQDKYDLMTKCEEELLKEMKNKIAKNIPQIISDLNERHTIPFAFLVPFFDYIQQNKGLMNILLSPNSDSSLQTKIKEVMTNALFSRHTEAIFIEEDLAIPKAYVISYIASAHLGVIKEWLDSGGEESPHEMARIISSMTLTGPLAAAGMKK